MSDKALISPGDVVAPMIGWLGEVLGPRASVLVAALSTGLAALGVLAYFMVHDGLRLNIERGRPLRIRARTLSGRPLYEGVR